MQLSILSILLALSLVSAAPTEDLEKRDTVKGFDISHYQGTVDFKGAYNSGARFVIIKVRVFPPRPFSPFLFPPETPTPSLPPPSLFNSPYGTAWHGVPLQSLHPPFPNPTN